MSTSPSFASSPRNSSVAVSTANTARDGSGTLGTVMTAGSAGSRVDEVTIKATGATTAGMLRFYVHNGTAAFLYREVPIGAATPSATIQAIETVVTFNNLFLPSGYSLRCAPHNAESFHVTATGGDF